LCFSEFTEAHASTGSTCQCCRFAAHSLYCCPDPSWKGQSQSKLIKSLLTQQCNLLHCHRYSSLNGCILLLLLFFGHKCLARFFGQSGLSYAHPPRSASPGAFTHGTPSQQAHAVSSVQTNTVLLIACMYVYTLLFKSLEFFIQQGCIKLIISELLHCSKRFLF